MTQTLPEQQAQSPGEPSKAADFAVALTVGLSSSIHHSSTDIALPGIVSYEDVWRALRQLSWLGIIAVSLATLINILTYGPNLMAALPGPRLPRCPDSGARFLRLAIRGAREARPSASASLISCCAPGGSPVAA